MKQKEKVFYKEIKLYRHEILKYFSAFFGDVHHYRMVVMRLLTKCYAEDKEYTLYEVIKRFNRYVRLQLKYLFLHPHMMSFSIDEGRKLKENIMKKEKNDDGKLGNEESIERVEKWFFDLYDSYINGNRELDYDGIFDETEIIYFMQSIDVIEGIAEDIALSLCGKLKCKELKKIGEKYEKITINKSKFDTGMNTYSNQQVKELIRGLYINDVCIKKDLKELKKIYMQNYYLLQVNKRVVDILLDKRITDTYYPDITILEDVLGNVYSRSIDVIGKKLDVIEEFMKYRLGGQVNEDHEDVDKFFAKLDTRELEKILMLKEEMSSDEDCKEFIDFIEYVNNGIDDEFCIHCDIWRNIVSIGNCTMIPRMSYCYRKCIYLKKQNKNVLKEILSLGTFSKPSKFFKYIYRNLYEEYFESEKYENLIKHKEDFEKFQDVFNGSLLKLFKEKMTDKDFWDSYNEDRLRLLEQKVESLVDDERKVQGDIVNKLVLPYKSEEEIDWEVFSYNEKSKLYEIVFYSYDDGFEDYLIDGNKSLLKHILWLIFFFLLEESLHDERIAGSVKCTCKG